MEAASNAILAEQQPDVVRHWREGAPMPCPQAMAEGFRRFTAKGRLNPLFTDYHRITTTSNAE